MVDLDVFVYVPMRYVGPTPVDAFFILDTQVKTMLEEYIAEAMRRAHYETITDDEPYYGEISDLPGVWATGKTLEECRENLKSVLEEWIVLSLREGLAVPELGGIRIEELREVEL